MSSMHVVYIDYDSSVIDHATGKECKRSYSGFDGDTWTDYYPAPCDVYLRREVKDAPSSGRGNSVQPKMRQQM